MSERELLQKALRVLKDWAVMKPVTKIEGLTSHPLEDVHWLTRGSIEHDTDDIVRKIEKHLRSRST